MSSTELKLPPFSGALLGALLGLLLAGAILISHRVFNTDHPVSAQTPRSQAATSNMTLPTSDHAAQPVAASLSPRANALRELVQYDLSNDDIPKALERTKALESDSDRVVLLTTIANRLINDAGKLQVNVKTYESNSDPANVKKSLERAVNRLAKAYGLAKGMSPSASKVSLLVGIAKSESEIDAVADLGPKTLAAQNVLPDHDKLLEEATQVASSLPSTPENWAIHWLFLTLTSGMGLVGFIIQSLVTPTVESIGKMLASSIAKNLLIRNLGNERPDSVATQIQPDTKS